MGIFKLVRLSTQVGLAGATVYCANEFNLFGDHGQATGGYQELKETVRSNEYYKEYAGPIVSEASQSAATTLAPAKEYLPSLQGMGGSARDYWNSGVMATFNGLANLPTHGNNAYSFLATNLSSLTQQLTESKPAAEEEAKPAEESQAESVEAKDEPKDETPLQKDESADEKAE